MKVVVLDNDGNKREKGCVSLTLETEATDEM